MVAKTLIPGQEVNRRCEKCCTKLVYIGKKASGEHVFRCPKCLTFKYFFEKVF
jgi:tRNA(Ile2) C34 agmatinyltransferase TiaS